MAKQRGDYSIDLDEGLEEYSAAEAHALKKMKTLGIFGPQKPPYNEDGTRFNGRIPSNLASFGPREISIHFNLMDNFTNYVAWQRLLGETATITAKEKLTLTEAAVRKTKAGNVQQRRDSTIVDARYVESNAEWLEAKTYWELLKGIEEAARRDLKFISRLIETKKLEWEQGRRGSNIREDKGERYQSRRMRSEKEEPPKEPRRSRRRRGKKKNDDE